MCRYCYCFLISLISLFSYGEGIRFEHYSYIDGLSQNSIRYMVQDSCGFLWAGSFAGINRFDGYNFKSYLSSDEGDNHILNNDITALTLDGDNSLWIGTREGLSHYNIKRNKFTNYLPDESRESWIAEGEIRALYIDNFDRVWVGYRECGLSIFDRATDKFTQVDIGDIGYVKKIFEDSKGRIWLGTFDKCSLVSIELDRKGDIKGKKYYNLDGENEKNPYLNFIFEDYNSDIYIGTRNGLFRWDKNSDSFVEIKFSEQSEHDMGSHFNSITRSPEGQYWIGTLNGLFVADEISHFSNDKYKRYSSDLGNSTSLVDNLVSSLYFDNSGVLWIGTENGLDKFDLYSNQFKTLTGLDQNIELKSSPIFGFQTTYDNRVIVATRSEGLIALDEDNQFTTLIKPTDKISSIYSPNGKDFYCGLWSGDVLIYNYVTGKSVVKSFGFRDYPIFAFCENSDGDILISSLKRGVVIYSPKSGESRVFDVQFEENQDINDLIEVGGNEFWFATESGVSRVDRDGKILDRYRHIDGDSNSLSHDNVTSLFIDIDGDIWAVTRTGLNRYNREDNCFSDVGIPEELKNIWITEILSDSSNRLWLKMNNNRVARYSKESGEVSIFYVESTNQLDVFSGSGFHYVENSNIYINGKNGIVYFNPTEIETNQNSTPPLISEVQIDNRTVSVGDSIGNRVIMGSDINLTRSLTLPYKHRDFGFTFTSTSYIKSEYYRYSYKLEGFDKSWREVDAKHRNARYMNLLWGKYTFKVKVCNSFGEWSEESSYTIKIEPPVWFSWQAIIGYILLLTAITIVVRKSMKQRQLLKHELLLSKIRQDRDEKLTDEKLRFFTNISHELKTPISLILGPTKQLLNDKQLSDYQKSRVSLIFNNGSRLLHLVNQLLEFRKVQQGELNLKISEGDIVEYIENVFNSFEEFAREKHIDFRIVTRLATLRGWIDRDKLDKILYNLLSNAIKFTPKDGNIELMIDVQENESRVLVVEVKDDGYGIPKDKQEKVFTRFYQVKEERNVNTGSGIGLSLVKALVDIHRAEITLESELNRGSIFTLLVPIDRDCYTSKEIFSYNIDKLNKEAQLPVSKIKHRDISAVDGIKEKVLVIDDNRELREFVAEYLSDYYKVLEAGDGQEGLRLCRKHKPLVCITDILMPVMDGYAFCEALKADEDISSIPVILLSALTDSESKKRGYQVGADSFLGKPFDPDLLKIRVDTILQNRGKIKDRFTKEVDINVTVPSHSAVDEEFITSVKKIIDSNITDGNFTVKELCGAMNISSSKLYRKLKELTDLSPNEFIRTIRLKRASELLLSKKYNVSEVANMVGFNDPLYFSRCFKKQFGVSPSKFALRSI